MPSAKRSLAPPAPWAAQGFALRDETAEDAPFLERLFISARIGALAPMGWPEEVKRAFLASQFALQSRHYAGAYSGPDFKILVRGEEPVGRLYLNRTATDLRIVDISLLPEWRRGGLGTALIQAVQADAAADGKTVSLSVDVMNPAYRLYRRLGFVEAGSDGASWTMVWTPAGAPS